MDNNIHVEPLFFKHSVVFPDLHYGKREGEILTPLEVCLSAERTIERDCIYGAQKIKNLWRLYPTNREARATLLVDGVNLRRNNVVLFDKNPYVHGLHDSAVQPEMVRINIKDIPLSYDNNEIVKYLRAARPGIKIDGHIQYSCERNEENNLTNYRNGDRFVKVEVDSLPTPFQRNVTIGRFKARIHHKGQPVNIKCIICGKVGHKAGSPNCENTKDNQNVVNVHGYQNILSNFHKTPSSYKGKTFESLEHSWVYAKCIENNLPEIAEKVHTIGHAGKAKKLSKEIENQINDDWDSFGMEIMEQLLLEKFDTSVTFRNALLETGQNIIAHSVPDIFWGTGLSPELSKCVDPAHWPGENKFGEILTKIRFQQFYCKEKTQSEQLESESENDDEGLKNMDDLDDLLAANETEETVAKVVDDAKDNASTPHHEERQSRFPFRKNGHPSPRVHSRRRRATSTPPDNRKITKAPKSTVSDEVHNNTTEGSTSRTYNTSTTEDSTTRIHTNTIENNAPT